MSGWFFVLAAAAGAGPGLWGSAAAGKWAFVFVLGALLAWLVLMPRRLLDEEQWSAPWWRNVRVWAIAVCWVQLLVYLCFA